jgi:hypothetical protein
MTQKDFEEWLATCPEASSLLIAAFREARASVDLDRGEIHTCHAACANPACVARREADERNRP